MIDQNTQLKSALQPDHIRGGSMWEAEIEPPHIEELMSTRKRKSSDGSLSWADSQADEDLEQPVKRAEIMGLIDKIAFFC